MSMAERLCLGWAPELRAVPRRALPARFAIARPGRHILSDPRCEQERPDVAIRQDKACIAAALIVRAETGMDDIVGHDRFR